MAQDTFGQIWNRLLLLAPGVPVPMAQEFVKIAYSCILGNHDWSDLWATGDHVISSTYNTGTASMTNGSTTIGLAGATPEAAWVTRQIKFAGDTYQPYYTITATATDSVTIDRNYTGATNTNSGFVVLEGLVEFPSDLFILKKVRDMKRQWVLRPRQMQESYLDIIDPDRSDTGAPYLIVAAPPRVESGVSTPRFEFYPRLSPATHIVYNYTKTADLTQNSDRIIPGIESEAVLYRALALVALWPGTAERPNPHFNMELHKKYMDEAENHIQASEKADMERAQTMVSYDDTLLTGIPADAAWRQSHGIPL